ncbi:arginine vasopressin receptor 1B [Phyllostomus discolor]|uniref:Vasopressin V1b receptor n=1 Tax=Phyllostomus discolor TaxID=89673 RepID=A0A6J2N4M1_9CHIR|nr:vasopressin V1b receptor [Phyllostomus discolor]KAF6074009.1 arginine vasopressin receptor 1B [Phyllostomus discolor]
MDSGPHWAANSIPGATLSAPNATTPWLGRDEELAKVEITVLATVLLLTTGGNLTVLLTLGQQGRKCARMHLFVLHLALTDLAVALFQVLPQLLWDITYRFQGPDPLCRAVKYLQALSMFASTYMLLAMTLDRYLAVCHPLRSLQQPSQSTYPLIAAPWLLAAILSLPQLFIFSLREVIQGSGVLDCWADFRFPWGSRAYITWTALAIFILPVAMLTACYSLICYEICKNLKVKTQTWRVEGGGWKIWDRALPPTPAAATRGLPSRVSSISTISRAKIRTVKMTFIIVLAYIICWAPFFSVQMWTVWDRNAPDEDSTNVVFTITMLLGNLSSCCNPWIYMGFNRHLWPHTLRHLACCGGPQPRMRRQLSNGSFSSRRTTLLLTRSSCPPTHSLSPSLSPSLSGRPGPEESPKDSEWVDREGVTEAGIF